MTPPDLSHVSDADLLAEIDRRTAVLRAKVAEDRKREAAAERQRRRRALVTPQSVTVTPASVTPEANVTLPPVVTPPSVTGPAVTPQSVTSVTIPLGVTPQSVTVTPASGAGKESGFSPVPLSGKEPPKKAPTGPKKGSAAVAPGPETVPVPAVLAAAERFPATWAVFIEHRRLIKEPMTHLAAERLLTRLAERPADAVEGLNLAIERQWQGFNWRYLDNERADAASRRPVNGHTHPNAPRRAL